MGPSVSRAVWAGLLLAWAVTSSAPVSAAAGQLGGEPRPVAGACPSGVPALTLSRASQDASEQRRSQARRRPAAFALPAEVTWGPDLAAHGQWSEGTDGAHVWQLCLHGPSAHSLTLLLRDSYLPLGSDLYIYNPEYTPSPQQECGVGCQHLTLHMLQTHLGPQLTAPIPGSMVVLEYRQPLSLGQPATPFAAGLQSVLLGLRPLPFAAPAAQRRRMLLSSEGQSSDQSGGLEAGSGSAGAWSEGGVYLRDGSKDTNGLESNLSQEEIAASMELTVRSNANTSQHCGANVACDPNWALQANAVVLLLAFDEVEGYFCTGTLINSPDNETQYILTANHCLGLTDADETSVYWGVMFNYEQRCDADTYPASYQLLQGVEVVWQSEISDVLLLRLDDEIPVGFTPYFMGWDASRGWAQPNSSVTIHHPLGDVKRIAYSYNPLQRGSVLVPEQTHYLVTWSNGSTQDGSSGAMLIDGGTKLGLGVLTGSATPTEECSGGSDYFGALFQAWEMGLYEYLGTGGVDGPATMGPRVPISDGPGLIINPDRVVVQEKGPPYELSVRLSDPPDYGELLRVNITVSPDNAPVLVNPTEMSFAGFDWNLPQELQVRTDDDPFRSSFVQGFLQFDLVFQLWSEDNSTFYKKRLVRGLRLNEDFARGQSAKLPLNIRSLPFNNSGRLTAVGSVPPGMKLSTTQLADFASQAREGSVAYYSISPATRTDITVGACSNETRLVMAVFVGQVAQWTSTQDCSVTNQGTCTTVVNWKGCTGFEGLRLPAVDSQGPHVIAVYNLGGTASSYAFEAHGKDGLTAFPFADLGIAQHLS